MSHVAFSDLVLINHLIREYFSSAPIDFEQTPTTMDSLNEHDLIVGLPLSLISLCREKVFLFIQVFLLLCAQQNVHLYGGDSTLNPYLLYSSSHLYTPSQKNWWLTAMEQTYCLFSCPARLAYWFLTLSV